MRKLFWGYAVCGATLAGGVFATAWYASQHPGSPVGRVLHGARTAAHAAPVDGHRTARDVSTAAEEPMPEEPAALPAMPVADAAPIVIRDDEPAVARSTPPLPEPQTVPGFEFVPAAYPAAPLTMPRCDEEECELLPLPMPAKPELLHMPAVDADAPAMPGVEEGQEEGAFGAADNRTFFEFYLRFMRPTQPATEAAPEAAVPECREDPNHHRHHPGCPASGPCMPSRTSTPQAETPPSGPCFPDTPEPIDPKKDDQRNEARKAIYKKLYQMLNRTMPEFGVPGKPGCDTMEFRPADGQLYEYGRGWL